MEYENFINVYDRDGNNTYWITVIYNHAVADEINEKLKHVYAILKAAGDVSVINPYTLIASTFVYLLTQDLFVCV